LPYISLGCVSSVSRLLVPDYALHTFQIHNNDSLIAAVYLFYQIERPFPGEKWSLNKSFSILVHVTAIFVANYQTSLQNSDPVLATFQT